MKRKKSTSERVEARDEIGREEIGIGEELFEANGLVVAAIVEKFVKKLECGEKVVLFQQKVHHAIAQRRSLHVHFLSLSLILSHSFKTRQEKRREHSQSDRGFNFQDCAS